MRHPKELMKDALAVINRACTEYSVWGMIPLFSGGHDSYCACYVASKHPKFKGEVFHLDTTIGSQKTKKFVQEVCDDEGWRLRVYKSTNPNDSYESIIRSDGFPGPYLHSLCYHRLKASSLKRAAPSRNVLIRGAKWALISGARQQESIRRMSHIQAIRVGDVVAKNNPGKPKNTFRLWVSPCYDWSGEEQVEFMNYHRLDRNPIKMTPLAMSGECFCGAFSRPGEYDLIKQFVPDVGAEIDRLSAIAKSLGVCHTYGGPRRDRPVEVPATGPMCNSCDLKMAAMGVKINDRQ